ncbi:LAMI_0H18492g1_1 [Lachancea mirantina]|uniref:LAMI_0H18492g1_1 n=1 Tax=Lachancea mirantina TaxID=1230905 RepID=A0A1G4KJI1_9SACH|nr:LAMI_0H18492g1_1 [Lachancea mirantina]
MKLFNNVSEFEYPWEQLSAANWRKYPNEASTHVKAVDVLRRELDPSGRRLISERLITCEQSVPKWISMLIGGCNVSYVREVSVVDLDTKTLTLRSCNLTCANILKVFETVKYSPHPRDSKKTLFEQEAKITAYAGISKLCNKIEEWSVNRFHENALKGKRGFDTVLETLSERWNISESLVDDIGSSLVDKINETVEDFKAVTEDLPKGTRHESSFLSGNYSEIRKAFTKSS